MVPNGLSIMGAIVVHEGAVGRRVSRPVLFQSPLRRPTEQQRRTRGASEEGRESCVQKSQSVPKHGMPASLHPCMKESAMVSPRRVSKWVRATHLHHLRVADVVRGNENDCAGASETSLVTGDVRCDAYLRLAMSGRPP